MRMKLHVFSILAMIVAASTDATATAFPTPFSPQGQIQNVQNYSNNPFWTPNAPYNQRLPQPILVQGAALDAGECQRTVSALIESYCLGQNYCRDIDLNDARPALMMQLSNMPNANYLSACVGYLDTEFATYKSKYNNVMVTGAPVAFPDAVVPNPNVDAPEFKIKNPYAPQIPDWAQEMNERKQELKDLQSQNGPGYVKLAHADFPTTIADVSFIDRMKNAAAGYEPFKDADVFLEIKIESEEDYLNRQVALLQQRQQIAKMKLSKTDYCAQFPGDTEYCNPTTTTTASTTGTQQVQKFNSEQRIAMINQITAALRDAQK